MIKLGTMYKVVKLAWERFLCLQKSEDYSGSIVTYLPLFGNDLIYNLPQFVYYSTSYV